MAIMNRAAIAFRILPNLDIDLPPSIFFHELPEILYSAEAAFFKVYGNSGYRITRCKDPVGHHALLCESSNNELAEESFVFGFFVSSCVFVLILIHVIIFDFTA